MARPPRPAATFTLGLQKRARPRKSVAKGGGRPGARASATTTPGQPRAALPQRATSRRALTTGRGAAARAAERSTLGAASGHHGWRTASRREDAGAGTAIAQHHAGTGGRAGCWNSRPAATCLRERARQAPAPTHPANAQRTAARRQTHPSRAGPSGPQPTQLPPIAADDQAECFPICYRPAGRRLLPQAKHSHPVRTPERGSAVGAATGLARYSARIPIGCESSRRQ